MIDSIFSFPLNTVIALLVLPFWFMRMGKSVLFYVYLWQLKEYHIGRFIAHFTTAKGERLLVNKVVFAKLFFLIAGIPAFVLLLYSLEAAKVGYDILRGRLMRPVPTKKTRGLILMNIGILLLFSSVVLRGINESWFSAGTATRVLLGVDIFAPIFISLIVLALQPVTVLARNRILAKAKTKRSQAENLTVIGITGSYGKTSTKEFLSHILSAKYSVLKTPEHMNSEVGIARTILNSLQPEHNVFVCEMGAYNKGGIQLLAEIAQPSIGVVTGVNQQHLATFGSMENLLSAEGGKELCAALPHEGTLFVNAKIKDKVQYKDAKCRIVYYGKVENIHVEKEKVLFSIDGVHFEVPAYGSHNIENIVGSIEVAKAMGMKLEEIAKAAKTMPLGEGSMQVKKRKGLPTIIDSTYSANPDGVIADLDYLSLYEGKKVLIMPCLIELGSAAKEVHKNIGKKIAEVCDIAVITTEEYYRDIVEGAQGSNRITYSENVEEIMGKTQGADVVLLEGGKESRVQRQLVSGLTEEK